LNYKKDGGVFWNRVLISPVFNGDELTYFFASQFDITRDKLGDPSLDVNSDGEMRRRIADLTASEQRLQFTLKAGGLGTWTLDIVRQRLVASAICKKNFGRGATDDFSYQDLQSSIHPDDFERWYQTLQAALESDGEFHIEYRIKLPDGGQRWIEIRAQTRFDGEHRPLEMSGVSVDITERKEAEAYRALINQEMSHRIKNTLATVQSIVSQSLRSELPPDQLRDVVARRLDALGGAHDVLTGRDWDIAGLKQTIQRAVRPFNADHRISLSGPDVEISHAVSSALTMALHELATNAVKYGALSNDTGTVKVEWQIDGEFALCWTESGGPTVTAPTRTGFGSRMIERALAASLKGKANVDYQSDGIRFELRTSPSALFAAQADSL
jgi:two-component sensor histidine kinase